MRNTLSDLNNHLFEQLERLNDEDMTPEEMSKEIQRSQAVTKVATSIIQNGQLMLSAAKFKDDAENIDAKTPRLLEG